MNRAAVFKLISEGMFDQFSPRLVFVVPESTIELIEEVLEGGR